MKKTFFAKLFGIKETKSGELKNLKHAPYNRRKEISDELMSELISKPRLLVTLILDISGSMRGEKLEKLKEGCREFILQAKKDEEANSRIDLKIVAFSTDYHVILDWTPLCAIEAEAPELEAAGMTAMAKALRYSWSDQKRHKTEVKGQGPVHHRIIDILITDGKPTDDMTGIAQEAERLEAEEGIQIWALGIPDENGSANEVAETLSRYFKRTFKNSTMDVTEFLRWMSQGMIKLSKSSPGETVDFGELPEDVTFIERKAVPSGLCN